MHSKISRTNEIVQMLRDGKNLALVSDAGTPGISDPGSELISFVRKVLTSEISDGTIKIESIPGASALTAALSIAGIPCHEFPVLGFLPHKKGRQTLFKEILSSERTFVFYESPHRILKTLQSLINLGADDLNTDVGARNKILVKKITICRELTKLFEEVVSGSPQDVLTYFEHNKEKVRGEFVVIVSSLL
jgi:16S rRNA (cytidine1402-2'-O)-methyltransferase